MPITNIHEEVNAIVTLQNIIRKRTNHTIQMTFNLSHEYPFGAYSIFVDGSKSRGVLDTSKRICLDNVNEFYRLIMNEFPELFI